MTTRYIDMKQYDADSRVIAWMEANELDPGNIPAAQYVQVSGEYLILQEFILGPEGFKLPLLDSSGEVCAWQKQTITRPLVSAPEDHGL